MRRRSHGCNRTASSEPRQSWQRRAARHYASKREATPDTRQTLDPALQEALIKLLGRGAALTGAQIVSTVPKDIAVAPAIRLLQRWGWDLLAERLAGRVRYYPQTSASLLCSRRTAEPVRVVDWTAALAQTASGQRSSAERASGS